MAFKTIYHILTPDTLQFASGDLIADTEAVANFFPSAPNGVLLRNFMVLDKDDQKAAFSVYLMKASTTFGTENSAPAPADAVASGLLAYIPIATTDYVDLGDFSIARPVAAGFVTPQVLMPATGTSSLYVAIINGAGTPTYTATGLVLAFGIEF